MRLESPPGLNPRRRLAALCAASCALGLLMALGAAGLLKLIALITNLAFFGRLSFHEALPASHALGAWAALVPAAGGLIVGLMARFGSRAIQGHGIPEAMEQVLFGGSRIPAKVLVLKPLSTCVVIGTGGPFGAEGVVIATGGALGSALGQLAPATALERKTLLAAGAAAGLSATFAAPVAAVLLAVELLLFEFHPRSLIPVSLASAAAAALRTALLGPGPMFEVPLLAPSGAASFPLWLALGAAMGLLAVGVLRLVEWLEEEFEALKVPWMLKPALGGLAIGLLGLAEPRLFGPGYPSIAGVLSDSFGAAETLRLGGLKLAAWALGVASATSSGTLAPLFMIGASGGSLFARLAAHLPQAFAVDPRTAALAGMAAFFGGMSGAFLASVVMAFEATFQTSVFMPVLASGASAYLVCRLLSAANIMTQKFHRQGVAVPVGFSASALDLLHVAEAASAPPVVLSSEQTLGQAKAALSEAADEAAGIPLPVAGPDGAFIGWLNPKHFRREADAKRPLSELIEHPLACVDENAPLREAVRRMIAQNLERLAVLSCETPGRLKAVLTQQDILSAYRHDDDGLDAGRTQILNSFKRPR